MLYLKQSTAVTVKLGQFLDDTDGKTAETALTISQADVRLSKNGGDIAQKGETSSCPHDELGIYNCSLNTTDTGTLGRLQIWVHETGVLPVYHEFMVVTAEVFDTLCGSDSFTVDLNTAPPTAVQIRQEIDSNSTQLAAILLDTGTTLDGKLDTIAGYLDTEIAAILADTGTTLDGKIDAIDAVVDAIRLVTDKLDDTLEDDGGTQRFTTNALEQAPSGTGGDASAANQTTIISHLTDIKGVTFSGSTDSLEAIRDRGDVAWLTGAGGSAPTVEDIRAEIDANSTQLAALAARITAARAGYLDKLNVTGTLAHSDAASTYQADISSLATAAALATLDAVADAIQLKTDTLPTDPADQSAIEAAITSAHGTTDGLLNTIAGYLDTEIAAILTNTGTTIPGLIAALNNPAAADIADAVLDEVLADLADNALNAGEDITTRKAVRALFNRFFREITQTATQQIVKNDSGSNVAVMTVSDDGTIQTKGAAT